MYKKILVPLDGSEQAEGVLPITCMLAKDCRADIVLVRVAEYPLEIYPTSYEYPYIDTKLAEVLDHNKSDFRREISDYLANIAQNLEKEGFKVITEVCEGPVVESILNATEYLGVDLITMATHSERKREYWLIGSIADRVLHEAKAHVILIRPTSDSAFVESPLLPSISHPV